jgi:uncharacterized protein (TIGR02246 family)
MSSGTREGAGMRRGIEESNRRFMESFNRGDAAGAARDVYTADATILPPGAAMVKGRDEIVKFWAGAVEAGIRRVELTTVSLEPMGDGACEIGRGSIGLADGQQMAAKYVVLWKQEDGRWLWHVDIWNS